MEDIGEKYRKALDELKSELKRLEAQQELRLTSLRLENRAELQKLIESIKELKEPEGGVTFTAKVLEDGRITIPIAIRKRYNIEKGDLIQLTLNRVIKKEIE